MLLDELLDELYDLRRENARLRIDNDRLNLNSNRLHEQVNKLSSLLHEYGNINHKQITHNQTGNIPSKATVSNKFTSNDRYMDTCYGNSISDSNPTIFDIDDTVVGAYKDNFGSTKQPDTRTKLTNVYSSDFEPYTGVFNSNPYSGLTQSSGSTFHVSGRQNTKVNTSRTNSGSYEPPYIGNVD